MDAKQDSQFVIERVNGKLCIFDLSPGDVPLVDESWFVGECTQLTPESPGLEVEDALQQGLQGVCAPRSPSDSPTKASLSAHGDSPRMSPGNPLTLASVRPAQSHVESVVSPARGSLAPGEVCRYSGSNCEPIRLLFLLSRSMTGSLRYRYFHRTPLLSYTFLRWSVCLL